MGGGAMIRTVTAAVGAAPTTTSNNLPTLPSSSSSNSRFLASGNFTAPFRRHCANRLCHGGVCRCEYVGGRQGERANESFINRVFGPTPSRFEVENAIAALQRWMKIFTSVYLFIFLFFFSVHLQISLVIYDSHELIPLPVLVFPYPIDILRFAGLKIFLALESFTNSTVHANKFLCFHLLGLSPSVDGLFPNTSEMSVSDEIASYPVFCTGFLHLGQSQIKE